MKTTAILLIAAMLITPIAALASVGSVSASHTAMVSVDMIKVKGGSTNIVTLTVANSSGSADPINVVQLYTVPSGWTSFAPLQEIPKDNLVILKENVVVLPAGTILEIWLDNDNIILPENSRVIVPDENQFKYPAGASGTTYTLANDNLEVEVTAETKVSNIFDNENMSVASELLFELSGDNKVKLLEDTEVIYVSPNVVKLPENILVQTIAENDNYIQENAELYFKDYYLVTLPVSAENVRCKESSVSATPSLSGSDMSNKIVQLVQRIVYIPPSTMVKIQGQPLARLAKYENENILVTKDTQLDVSGATVENRPNNWMQDAGNRKWTGIGDNKIAVGSEENFPFTITAPSAGGTYTFYVRTTDTAGSVKDWVFTIEVDNSISVDVSADKTWVGGGENVTITVSSDEPFTFDNIVVYENNAADENKVVWTVDNATPNADNTEWTVVYTTHENEDWTNADGYLTIVVNNATDEVGNTTTKTVSNLVFVDRRAPPAPSLSTLGVPTGIENKGDWEISITLDNGNDNLIFTPDDYSPENLLLEILVDNQVVASGTAIPTGLVSFTLSLSEGKHTIAARITDKAGNIGKENSDNVVIDTTAPTVDISSPSDEKVYNTSDLSATDNKITISVAISDSVLGIDNTWLNQTYANTLDNLKENILENENWDLGWTVVLTYENGDIIRVLQPKTYPTIENEENVREDVFLTFNFENDLDVGALLADNTLKQDTWYYIKVLAGDNMSGEKTGAKPHRTVDNVKFKIDISVPSKPSLTTTTYQQTSSVNPQKTNKPSFYLSGTAEAGATVKIYILNVETGSTIDTINVEVDSTGNWSHTLNLSSYEGQTVKVDLATVDAAGNESTSRELFGYFLYDASAPTVTIASQYNNISTDKASVVITGSVTIDNWESYSDITLTVGPSTAPVVLNPDGTFSVSVPLFEGQNLVVVTATDGVGNASSDSTTITRTVTSWALYAIVLVIIALVLAAIAIFRRT